MDKFSKVHPSINFDFNYSKTQIHFLDITITKTSTGIVSTKLWRKEITRQSYVKQKSQHPETLRQSIPILKR